MYRILSRLILGIFLLLVFSLGKNLGENIEIYKYKIDTPLLKEKYPVSFGSGIFFVGKEGGDLIFLSITDRGPNVDSPDVLLDNRLYPSKIFLVPEFSPKIGYLRVSNNRCYVDKYYDVYNENREKSTGKPLSLNKIGSTGEIPIGENLRVIDFDDLGIDPEGITLDDKGFIWICEEYGPSIIKIEPQTYRILERYYPGKGLPEILKWRQPNRGFEAITFQDKKIYAVVQSTLDIEGKTKNNANFVRIVEFTPENKKVNMYAYPLDEDYSKYSDGMIGDMTSLGKGRFLILERGKLSSGYKNIVYLIDLNSAVPIPETLDESQTKDKKIENRFYVKKTKIIDLRNLGYNFEKSEGLALIQKNILAILNDNDFGVKSNLSTLKSPQLINGRIWERDTLKDVTENFKILSNEEILELWIIKLPFYLE
ncbi:MAG: esterase-like activity of phytase family protein [Dictyoglomaceae bacterium]